MNARRAPDDPVEWLNRAESSLTQASLPLSTPGLFRPTCATGPFAPVVTPLLGIYLEDLCGDAHQAAEKAIKAVLLFKNVDCPVACGIAVLGVLQRLPFAPMFPTPGRPAAAT